MVVLAVTPITLLYEPLPYRKYSHSSPPLRYDATITRGPSSQRTGLRPENTARDYYRRASSGSSISTSTSLHLSLHYSHHPIAFPGPPGPVKAQPQLLIASEKPLGKYSRWINGRGVAPARLHRQVLLTDQRNALGGCGF